MITIDYQGGFGNKLWQYAAGRILSKKTGLCLVSGGIQGLVDCPRILRGNIILSNRINLEGHFLPSELTARRIHMAGYFERYENVSGHLEEISRWFQPKAPAVSVRPDALTISIRRGSNNWPVDSHCPSKDYYIEKIHALGYRKHYLCTDSPDDIFIKEISEELESCDIVRSNTLSQFNFLQNSKNIFLAPSTFSWWAAMTGKAEVIFWPQIPALDFTRTKHDWFPTENEKLILV